MSVYHKSKSAPSARASSALLSFRELAAVIGNGIGVFNVPCPLCSPFRRHPERRKLKVLRIWRNEPGFITFCCKHCDAVGYAHDHERTVPLAPQQIAQRMREADAARREREQRQRSKALWLWDRSLPIHGTIAETYLQRARAITCDLPNTLRFLPGTSIHAPALIAPFGLPSEPVPGSLGIEDMAITAVHLTRLKRDGSDREPEGKRILGSPSGRPLVMSPVNDIGGLSIAEGIEDALSLYQALGTGAWAAGSASHLAALAYCIPPYVEAVTILVDGNDAGRRHSAKLAERILAISQGEIEVRLLDSFPDVGHFHEAS